MSIKKVKLTKELLIDGVMTKEVELDFEKLTAGDLLNSEAEARADGETNPMITFSMKYQAAVAARLIGVSYDDVKNMNAIDFSKLTTQVLAFLTL